MSAAPGAALFEVGYQEGVAKLSSARYQHGCAIRRNVSGDEGLVGEVGYFDRRRLSKAKRPEIRTLGGREIDAGAVSPPLVDPATGRCWDISGDPLGWSSLDWHDRH